MRSPVYYLSLRARNGAGVVNPTPKISTPIMVVEEDKAGMSCLKRQEPYYILIMIINSHPFAKL
jgi:hypothetical protein